MPSLKAIVFGGIALGGVAVAASYLTYKWYKYRQDTKTTKFAGTINCKLMNQIMDLKSKARNKAIVKPTIALVNQTKVQDRVHDMASSHNEEFNGAQSASTSTENDVQRKPAESSSAISNGLPLEHVSNEQQNAASMSTQADVPIYVPKLLQGMKSMKEFENTLEALAAFLLVQGRSEEELLEAQQELGWWWNVVVAFKDRVPKKIPDFENMLPLENEDGMQSVD